MLRAVLDHGPIARSTIARVTGLSPASVTGHCAELMQLELLRDLPDQVRSRGVGRPHVPVDLNVSPYAVVAAVHVAVPMTTTALLDLRGRVIARSSTPHESSDPEHVLERAALSVAALCADLGDVRPLGIGVATGGWVEPASGIVMDHPRLGWSRVPVRDWLSSRTGLPVRVDGHSRALLHGEVLFGGARHAAAGSVLHVIVGNVVESAFVVRGAMHHGARAQAGVIAHLPVSGSRELCSCGRTGCLEATVSEGTLAGRAHRLGLIAAPDFELLLSAALAGSRGAVELLVARSRLLGWAVALLMDVFGPDLVVVSDAALPVLPAALAALRDAVRENVRMVCEVDRILIPTSFPGAVRETAAGAVILDSLYRDPWGFKDWITSESCNVDTPGERR